MSQRANHLALAFMELPVSERMHALSLIGDFMRGGRKEREHLQQCLRRKLDSAAPADPPTGPKVKTSLALPASAPKVTG